LFDVLRSEYMTGTIVNSSIRVCLRICRVLGRHLSLLQD
jgi:hypothetical protein